MSGTFPVPPSPPADVGVAVASGGADWELALIPLIERHRSGLHLVRRCVDAADLLSVCSAGLVRVAVVAGGLARLDADGVARLRTLGVSVLAVDDSAAPDSSRRLVTDGVAPAGTPADELARLVRELASTMGASTGRRARPSAADEASPRPEVEARLGRLVAVWGPTGAPGRSTVAVNVAAERARCGGSQLVVDADTSGGAVSTMLGVLDEAPGLAAACRSASRGRLDRHVLATHALVVDDDLRVLTGATRPDRWRELRPAALQAVWNCARGLADDVVVDLGAGLSVDPADPLDVSIGAGGVARAVLAEADRVLVVGTADPLGMLRLVHALDQLREQVPHADYDVVVNRVRASVAGTRPERQVRQSLARFAGVETVHLLPDDPTAADRALRDGVPLAVAAPGAPLRRSLLALSAALAPVVPAAAGTTGRRFRRRRRRATSSVRSAG